MPEPSEECGPNFADTVEAAEKWWTKIDMIMSNRHTIYPNAALFEQCKEFLDLPVIKVSHLMEICSKMFAGELSHATSKDEMSEKTEDFIPLLKYTIRFIEKFAKFPKQQNDFLRAFREIIITVATGADLIFSVETLEDCIDQAAQIAQAFPDSKSRILRWIDTIKERLAKIEASTSSSTFKP